MIGERFEVGQDMKWIDRSLALSKAGERKQAVTRWRADTDKRRARKSFTLLWTCPELVTIVIPHLEWIVRIQDLDISEGGQRRRGEGIMFCSRLEVRVMVDPRNIKRCIFLEIFKRLLRCKFLDINTQDVTPKHKYQSNYLPWSLHPCLALKTPDRATDLDKEFAPTTH